jgi:hypothetical protein
MEDRFIQKSLLISLSQMGIKIFHPTLYPSHQRRGDKR